MPKDAKRRSMGGADATLGRYAKVVRSKELAEERAVVKRKEEGKSIEQYQKVLKDMGLEESEAFKKRKAQYEEKLQAEKDRKHRRQATKRKKKEAEAKTKADEEGKKGPQDVANPFRKVKQKFDAKKHEKDQEMARRAAEEKARAEEIAKANKRRMTTHLKLQQKTKRGQPIMANKMDYLMGKIQKSFGGK